MKTPIVVGKLLLLLGSNVFANQHEITIDNVIEAKKTASTCEAAREPSLHNTDEYIPNDPLFNHQWGLRNMVSGFDIAATKAWNLARGSKKIAIVVIDTGIDYTHPDLVNNMWVNPGEIPANGIDDDGNGYIDDIHGINAITGTGDPMDDNGHGTHIAGIIGSEGDNGIGTAGVMHHVSLIACKFLRANGSGTTEEAIKCLNYVADIATRDIGVTIVATNNAWGGGPFSQPVLDAIERHRDLGILFVTGSGSHGTSLDDSGIYPALYDSANVIVIAKADQGGKLAWFSNFGPNNVHLAAPGENIFSTYLNGEYKSLSGSPATGFASGIIGLLKSHNPELTWAQVKHRLMAGTVRLATPEDESKLISGGFSNAFNSLSR